MRVNTRYINSTRGDYVPCIYMMKKSESYHSRLGSLMYLCCVVRALIHSLVCWFRILQLSSIVLHPYQSVQCARVCVCVCVCVCVRVRVCVCVCACIRYLMLLLICFSYNCNSFKHLYFIRTCLTLNHHTFILNFIYLRIRLMVCFKANFFLLDNKVLFYLKGVSTTFLNDEARQLTLWK